MGASQGKEENVSMIPPPSSVRNVINIDSEDTQADTLDKSLKGFLKKYNMGGLEYRLRLAGIYTLEDLVASDEAILNGHGFTRLMSRRLFRALISHVNDLESQSNQSQHHKIRPSTLLRSRENYGKPNKRRVPFIREESVKRPTSPVLRKISVSPQLSHKLKVLGTPSIDAADGSGTSSSIDLSNSNTDIEEVIAITIDTDVVPAEFPKDAPEEQADPSVDKTDDGVSSPMIPSPIPTDEDQDIVTLSKRILQVSPTAIEHHLSLPLGLDKIKSPRMSLCCNDRSLSCPCLASLDDEFALQPEEKPDELTEILSALENHEVNDVEKLLVLLYTLLDIVKSDACLRSMANLLDVVSSILNRHLHNVMVAEVSCRILKHLAFNLNLADSTCNEKLEKVAKVILDVIKSHPFNKHCQLNGCLVINNVFRSAHPPSVDINNVFSILCVSLDAHQKDETVVVCVLAAMVAVLASSSVSDSPLTVSQQVQLSLEQLCTLSDLFLENVQITQYILSFFTLSLIDVAPLVDDNIMRSIIKAVVLSMNAHKEKLEMVVCGCKTISQLAPHKLVEDEGTSKELTDCLLDALSQHIKSSRVQTWGSYALYQLASYNSTLIPHVKNSGCLEERKNSLPHLNEEAQSYIEQLAQLATL